MSTGMRSIEENLQLVELFDKNLYNECSVKLTKIEDCYVTIFNKVIEQKYLYNADSRQIHKEKKDIIKKLLEGSSKVIGVE